MAIVREEWRNVKGYEGYYQVSNKGRVRRIVEPGIYRVMKPYTTTSGYFQVGLIVKGIRKQPLVHQLVAVAFIGPCPEGKQVNHKDGVKKNNRPRNLEYVTSRENTIHAGKMGFLGKAKGEGHGRSKLKEADVLQICEMAKVQRIPHRVIAEQFGIATGYVCQIIGGIRWKHLTEVERST